MRPLDESCDHIYHEGFVDEDGWGDGAGQTHGDGWGDGDGNGYGSFTPSAYLRAYNNTLTYYKLVKP